jgi:hypothetical protein
MHPQLDELVALLLQKETVDQSQIADILGPRPTNTEETMSLTAELSL